MADQGDNPGDRDTTPTECRPCSGSGKVISNLGGTPSEITCPWCEGTGKFIADHDAQAHWMSDPLPESGEDQPS